MGKYLIKRILYSIFSIVCVMIVMIFLLFTLKDKEVIFQGDPLFSKKKGNDLTYYKHTKWEKYGYIDLIEFENYINEKYADTLDYDEYEKAIYLPNDIEGDADNPKIKEFIDLYESKGYKIERLYSEYVGYGEDKEVKEGYDPYLFAYKNHNTFHRLWTFFRDMFKVETVNDVDNFVKKNDLKPTKGYYLVSGANDWENFYKYWGSSNYKLNYSSTFSDETMKTYYVSLGVFDDEMVDSKYEWNVVYYDGASTVKKISETNEVITSTGEYNFFLDMELDSQGKATSSTISSLPNGANPRTRRQKGGLIEVQNKGIKVIWDEYSNMPAIVGNGTTHKYLLYFDNQFPFIHQNFIHFSLGYSNDENEVLSKLFDRTGEVNLIEQEFPSKLGTGERVKTSFNFHTATFTYSKVLSEEEISR